MSRLISTPALYTQWKLFPRSILLDQLPRLLDYILIEQPEALPRFFLCMASLVPESDDDQAILDHLVGRLPLELRVIAHGMVGQGAPTIH